MKVLVTGGNSFIGSTLIEELDTLGFEVAALLGEGTDISHPEGVSFRKIDGNLTDFASLCQAVREVDYVFHLEEITQASHPKFFFETNARGTERLARAVSAVNPNLARFVFVSSLAAGGPSSSLKPRIELETEAPVSIYGQSKLEGEKRLLAFKEVFPISIVRPSMVYGPRDRSLLILFKALARNWMPIFQGSTQEGHKYFSAIHVQDLCRGLVQAAVSIPEKVPSGDLFYLSGDGIHTYQDLVTLISERLNCDPLRIKIPKFALQATTRILSVASHLTQRNFALNFDKLQDLLSDYWICSNQKARNNLSFMPEFDLASGITHAIEWYKKQRWI